MDGILGQAADFLKSGGYRLAATAFVLVAGFLTIRCIVRLLKMAILSSDMDPSLVNFILTLVKLALYLALIIYCLSSILGISATGFIAALSALMLAIGLSVQNAISSVANGIMLFLTRPFKAGDYIDVGGVSGSVKEIRLMHTILNTPDNRRVIIPNSSVFNGAITNYSANLIRRAEIKFSADYDSDPDRVRSLLLDLCVNHSLVLSEPAPAVKWNAHNDSYLEFIVRVWVKSENYWTVVWELEESAYHAFRENGICIPFPQITLGCRDDFWKGVEMRPCSVSREDSMKSGGRGE